MDYTFTPADNADPTAVAEYTARLAKLRPACTRCGHTLGKREIASGTGQCASRDDCLLRQVFAARPPGGKALCISEVHERIRFRRTRGREIVATDSAPKNRAEILLDRETAGENIAPDEWRPLNPFVWRPRATTERGTDA